MSDFSSLRVAGLPVLPAGVPQTTGHVFFVSNNTALTDEAISGSDGNDGRSAKRPFSTLAKAITQCVAGRGDLIIVGPGHAETVSTTITPVAGSAIVGLGFGRNRPVFTASTGAIDTFTISANNVQLQNFVIVGAASGCTALLEISGTNPRFLDMEIQGGVTPTSLVTVSAGADNAVWKNVRFRAAAGTAIGIVIEATAIAPDWLMEDIYFHGSSVRDIDTALIQMSKKSLTGLIMNRWYAIGVVGGDNVAGVLDFNSSTGVIDGLISNGHVTFDAPVTLTEAFDAGGMAFSNVFVTDIVTAKGTAWPATTAS